MAVIFPFSYYADCVAICCIKFSSRDRDFPPLEITTYGVHNNNETGLPASRRLPTHSRREKVPSGYSGRGSARKDILHRNFLTNISAIISMTTFLQTPHISSILLMCQCLVAGERLGYVCKEEWELNTTRM